MIQLLYTLQNDHHNQSINSYTICHHINVTKFFSCDENFQDLLFNQLSHLQYNIFDYSHCVIYKIPMTYFILFFTILILYYSTVD